MNVIYHYDKLIDENNDPVYDPEPLKEYMNKWDGQVFIDAMRLDETKTVLEIGVGTGRLALKTIPLCKSFVGIDISPKTIEKADKFVFESIGFSNRLSLPDKTYSRCGRRRKKLPQPIFQN